MPSNATAEYVIVPNTTAETMRLWVASNPISIVANDSIASAVRRGETFGIAFWSAGSVEGYESNAPAVVYITESKAGITLSAADPTNGVGTLRITVPGRFSGRTRRPVTAPPRSTSRETAGRRSPRLSGGSGRQNVARVAVIERERGTMGGGGTLRHPTTQVPRSRSG